MRIDLGTFLCVGCSCLEEVATASSQSAGCVVPCHLRGTESGIPQSSELLMASPESFDIEDDGSSEWQFVVDLIVMISAASTARMSAFACKLPFAHI